MLAPCHPAGAWAFGLAAPRVRLQWRVGADGNRSVRHEEPSETGALPHWCASTTVAKDLCHAASALGTKPMQRIAERAAPPMPDVVAFYV